MSDFETLRQISEEDAREYLEIFIRSIYKGHNVPLSKDKEAPWQIVDREGKVFVDCRREKIADKFLGFLKSLDLFFV